MREGKISPWEKKGGEEDDEEEEFISKNRVLQKKTLLRKTHKLRRSARSSSKSPTNRRRRAKSKRLRIHLDARFFVREPFPKQSRSSTNCSFTGISKVNSTVKRTRNERDDAFGEIPPEERLGTVLFDGKTNVNSRLAFGFTLLRVACRCRHVRRHLSGQWKIVHHD